MIRTALLAAALVTLAACGQPSSTPAASSSPAPSAAPAGAAEPSPEEIAADLAKLPAPYNTADYEAGRRVFAQCRSCHTAVEGAGNRVGPNLHGVFGRKAGSIADFNYSDPVKNAGFTWDADHLDHWLENPRTFLPGNRMAFIGVRDETQRHNLIAYLMVESEK
jgi:cytochrome c